MIYDRFILNDNSRKPECLYELFRKRREDVISGGRKLPKSIEQREYDVKDVQQDIKDIHKFVTNLIKTNYKEFYKKGIEPTDYFECIYPFGDEEDEETNEAQTYESGQNFRLFNYDLWDYKSKESPRDIIDDNNGNHPVYDAMHEIEEEINEYLKKYKGKYKCEEDGDWDDGSVYIEII